MVQRQGVEPCTAGLEDPRALPSRAACLRKDLNPAPRGKSPLHLPQCFRGMVEIPGLEPGKLAYETSGLPLAYISVGPLGIEPKSVAYKTTALTIMLRSSTDPGS